MEPVYEDFELNPEVDIPVNSEELDVEWIRQSNTYLKYATAAAQLDKEVKQAHENVKVTRSRLVKEAQTFLDKPTGPNVEAYYRSHPDHIDAKQEQIDAEYERDIMFAAKSAVYMKKTVLENITRMSSMGWFSTPVAPKSMEELSKRLEELDGAVVDSKVRKATKGIKRTKK